MNKQLFIISGMHCEACTKLSAKRIRTIDGVTDASVDLVSGLATVVAEKQLDAADINNVFNGYDYTAEAKND